ncbi:LOW QUALITY PROTEIN: uncharacterized protein [Argopecten irradians]|uniref:LOW QUALITY PROTEIN: uncharacterized protein n=1 Tax=Argopecten irradians TaxID=31199 RepID=UPI00372131BA
MSDQGELYGDSWILYHVLDRLMGNQEMVAIRRKLELIKEQILNTSIPHTNKIGTGSKAEGVDNLGSDSDYMIINNTVVVICPGQDTSSRSDIADKTVFIMRDANSRPGYVKLELDRLGDRVINIIIQSIVPVYDLKFISSDMYKESFTDFNRYLYQIPAQTHGPATTLLNTQSKIGTDIDYVYGFRCNSWPREADEWVSRPRLHGWPGKGLIDQIVEDGCYLVPVGDRTSPDTFLQWRISFAPAECKLIHSVSHVQFLVYCLLKYFLKQISGMLKQIYGDEDILSSYIIKTVLFHALESTPKSFWQEKNIFLCFLLCLNILTSWVKTAYCPNYFISKNNMFLGKVHGDIQENLLHFLVYLHDMGWGCLSIGTFFRQSIGQFIRHVKHGDWEIVLATPAELERDCDFEIMRQTITLNVGVNETFPVLMTLLCRLFYKSETDMDDFVAYYHMSNALSVNGMQIFEEKSVHSGNKNKYKCLRKSKKFMAPHATVCSSPGLLRLATYHYQTGNYIKTLEMCGHVISSWNIFVDGPISGEVLQRYEHLYCGRSFHLLHKCQQVFLSTIEFSLNSLQTCPLQLHPELQQSEMGIVSIPPLPYALFLSFLCYHELGDTRRRGSALRQLQTEKRDKYQGVNDVWIVHNLLGICYEMIGDYTSASTEYRDSLGGDRPDQHENPARDRIERLERSH